MYINISLVSFETRFDHGTAKQDDHTLYKA